MHGENAIDFTLGCKNMRQYILSVGEPWDFESPDGQNRVIVVLLGFINGPCSTPNKHADESYLLLEAATPFVIRGELVKFMVASPRYAGESIESVASKGGTVGVARVRPGITPIFGGAVGKSEIDYCIIGSLIPYDFDEELPSKNAT